MTETTRHLSDAEREEIDATLVARDLAARGHVVTWVEVRQVSRSGRVRWVTRGTWGTR